jgi:uncharacterized membrane protein YpjA
LLLRRGLSMLLYWFSKEGLTSPFMMKTLLWVNALGTVYGFYWYWGQLEYTLTHHPVWRVFLVPDSPTASLFFTVALWWLYIVPERRLSSPNTLVIRSFVEAFAVVTSVKYGIWAVAMIFAAAAQGDALVWQDYMLTVSHIGMAVEALLFARFFRFGVGALAFVGLWTIYNDFADYKFGIYPGLPNELEDDLGVIQVFTTALSLVSLCTAWLFGRAFRKSRV